MAASPDTAHDHDVLQVTPSTIQEWRHPVVRDLGINLPDYGHSAKGSEASAHGSPSGRMGREEMMRLVESVLRIQLAPIRRAGLDVRVKSSDREVLAYAVTRRGRPDRELHARLVTDSWWDPGDVDRGSAVAAELGSQLLAQWRADRSERN